jgi:predicted dehydrogenase
MEQLKCVSIGGFGHSILVFDDMLGMEGVQLCGLAPAYPDEDLTPFTTHEFCKDKPNYKDYERMLEEIKPDVAIVSSRLDMIPEVMIKAAQAGCHLIAEKPLALNHSDLSQVHQAVKENNIKAVAMLSMRSEPPFRAARRIYQSGEVGEAVLVNGRKSYKWGQRPEWFGERDKYGSTIGWVGIHAFDFINYVTGLEFTQVAAMHGNFAHPQRPACQDNCGLVFGLSNGGHGTISVDYLRPENAQTWGDDWIRVVGTKGVIEASGSKNNCTVLVDGKESYNVDLPVKGRIFEEFLLGLMDHRDCELTQHDSFMLTSACLYANEAASNQTVARIKSRDWN